jgi:hypothetical protein
MQSPSKSSHSRDAISPFRIPVSHAKRVKSEGAEYASRTADFDPTSDKYVGYGSPFFSNSGCFTETVPGVNNGFSPGGLSSCTADTRVLIEGSSGFWYRVYDGSRDKTNHGRVQWGAQYSYVTRNTWSGSDITRPGGKECREFRRLR